LKCEKNAKYVFSNTAVRQRRLDNIVTEETSFTGILDLRLIVIRRKDGKGMERKEDI